MADLRRNQSISNAAGLSGGTGFAGLVLLMGECPLRSALLILAPAVTVCTSKFWTLFMLELDSVLADWRIDAQLRRAKKFYSTLVDQHPTESDLVQTAKKNMEALSLLQVENMQKRVKTILAS